VSADAMQVYRGLPILTNQPARPTRLVGIRPLSAEMSVGEYAPLAHAAIDELVAARGYAVIAGGTGLYLRAAVADLDIPPPPAPEARARWERLVAADARAAHERLATLDPIAAGAVHANDRRRLVRALELAELGTSLVPAVDGLWGGELRRPTLVVGLEVDPAELERRIRVRAEEMIARGVLDEVREALAAPLSRTAAKALGLRELAELPIDLALDRIVIRTRRYAAYQRKWLRRLSDVVTVDATRTADEVVDAILEVARAR